MHLATWEMIQVLPGSRTKEGQSSRDVFVEEEGLSRGWKGKLSTIEQEIVRED